MERFEGMRVKIEVFHIVAPTGGWVNEKTGIATSDGIFFGIIAGTPRPFREAGLDKLRVFIDKLPTNLSVLI